MIEVLFEHLERMSNAGSMQESLSLRLQKILRAAQEMRACGNTAGPALAKAQSEFDEALSSNDIGELVRKKDDGKNLYVISGKELEAVREAHNDVWQAEQDKDYDALEIANEAVDEAYAACRSRPVEEIGSHVNDKGSKIKVYGQIR
jgi:hypothetical protein